MRRDEIAARHVIYIVIDVIFPSFCRIQDNSVFIT